MATKRAVPSWLYNEWAKAGVDYNDTAIAAEYDNHCKNP